MDLAVFGESAELADGLEFIANWNAAMFDTDDMAEAFAAQMDKRDPDFPDLWPLSEGLWNASHPAAPSSTAAR